AEAAVRAEDEELLRPVARRARVRRRADPRPRADRRERGRVDAVREDVVRAVPEDPREQRAADERHEEQEEDEPDADDGQLVAAEADPDELPVAARLDLLRGDRVERNDVNWYSVCGGGGVESVEVCAHERRNLTLGMKTL